MSLHLEQLDLQKLLEQLLDEAWPSFEKNGLEASSAAWNMGFPWRGTAICWHAFLKIF